MNSRETATKRPRITAASLFGLNIGLIVLLIVVVGGVVWFEREQAIAQAERNARNLNDVLAAQTREQFQSIDKSLTAILQRIHPDVITDEDQSERTYDLLRDALRTAPSSVLFYYLVSSDGHMLNTSLDPTRVMQDLSSRPGFRLQRDDPSVQFFIGPTLRGLPNSLTDRLIFSVNRRITRSDGSFGGLVSALIAVDLLTDLYDALNVGEDGVVSLIHRQGHMLARSPIDERVIGSDFSGSNVFVNGVNKAPVGFSTTYSVADGKARITAYRVVDDFPLVVTVGLLRDAELASWQRYATISAVATISIAVLLLLMLSVMQKRIRQSIRDEGRFIEAELRRKQELETYSQQLQKAQEMANIGTWRMNIGSDVIEISPMLQRLAGRDVTGKDSYSQSSLTIHPDDRERYFAARDTVIQTGQPQQVEYRLLHPDGSLRYRWSEMQCEVDDKGEPCAVFATEQDITDRKTTDEQLRQSQKMETIGHLTGGVAHDFNTLLMVVMGNLDLLLDRLKHDPDTAGIVNAAISAAERGASLTRQLLAYARRQPLAPSDLDVNAAVQGISRLLRRTLGEQIEIETILGGGVWHALADGTQVENAVLNLAINARDAMPTGGKLTLETSNASFDDSYAGLNDEVLPGQYVMIAVTDTGTGMPADVAARAFEPFFTTKPVGRGTGLGLSMVYGFAKQSGGHAKIYSELGHGTTVRLYLPRARNTSTAESADTAPATSAVANETILVVEDDELVRSTVERMLKESGYKIYLAPTAEDALPILDSDTHIDLLFTDVVLPGKMGGKALAEYALLRRPGLTVLYSSGYTQNSIIHQGRLDADVELLSKPYKKADLVRRLRSLLNKRKAKA